MESFVRLRWLWAAIALAIGVRIAVWIAVPRTTLLSDEGEYLSAAQWLAYGRGFAWYLDYFWTRAPLYPLLVSFILRAGGNPTWVAVVQGVLSLSHVVLVWLIARRLWPQHSAVANIAAVLVAVALPLATATVMVLTETLYLTLMLTILWLAVGFRIAQPSIWRAAALGILLALATLTRGMTIVYIPVLILWMRYGGGAVGVDRARATLVMLCACVAFVAPWSIYASRTYGGVVLVDTTGAYNLLVSAHAAADPAQSSVRTDAFVAALIDARAPAPEQSCAPFPGVLATQGARQAAMTREAVCLIAAYPVAFVQRIPGEFVSFWQIRYGSAERFTKGFTIGNVSATYARLLFWLDDVWYVLVLFPALVGLWAMRRDGATRSQHEVFLIFVLIPIVLGAGVFSITRFRLILLPMLAIAAAGFISFLWQRRWRELVSPGAGITIALASVIWCMAATPWVTVWPGVAPSFFGPSPSVLFCNTLVTEAQVLRANSDAYAAQLYADPFINPIPQPLPLPLDRVGVALQASWQGRAQDVAGLLPADDPELVEIQITRADALRTLGDRDAAKKLLGDTNVDRRNPVEWAWQWLKPAPSREIDVGNDLDLGYIRGCYLGEGDAVLNVNLRWCSDGAQFRFPAAGNGATQRLALRVDGRGWPTDVVPSGPIEVWVDNRIIGTFAADTPRVRVEVIDLPVQPQGGDIVITLRGPTFVPDANDYRKQRGPLTGQMRRLMIRLDWLTIQ
ncbi:MAG: hypothetical protein RLY87_1229 [Chloroflexota bacterium]